MRTNHLDELSVVDLHRLLIGKSQASRAARLAQFFCTGRATLFPQDGESESKGHPGEAVVVV